MPTKLNLPFRIACTQCAYLRAKHANPLIFMVFGRKVEAGIVGGHKNWHEVEMGVANKMTSSVLDREHTARAFAHKKRANQLVFMVCGEKRQLELS